MNGSGAAAGVDPVINRVIPAVKMDVDVSRMPSMHCVGTVISGNWSITAVRVDIGTGDVGAAAICVDAIAVDETSDDMAVSKNFKDVGVVAGFP